MKRIFLFLCLGILSLATNSCSDDDKEKTYNPAGTLSFKLDGVTVTYDYISLVAYNNGGNDNLNFTASNNGSSSDYVTFYVYTGETGADQVHNFRLIQNSNEHTVIYVSNTTANSNGVLQSNFSGTASIRNNDGTYTDVPLTNGVINITY